MDTQKISGFHMNGSNGGDIVLVTDESLECPFCHVSIETQALSFIRFLGDNIQIFLKCKRCSQSFIGYTNKDGNGYYRIVRLSKGNHKTTKFDTEIEELSSSFSQIFGEAEYAEQENLMQICGVGYRKALEFLIKDYLTFINPKDGVDIKKKLLGQCIKDHISDPKIKAISEKATWLGNDETHYVKKWEDKDLNDLKKLINITLHFVLMDVQSRKYIEEMSKPL